MKIFRYVANVRGFSTVHCMRSLKWWPDGIDMGKWMERTVPKYWHDGDRRWLLSHNHYERTPLEFPLPDFMYLALNLPLVSERAERVLRAAKMITKTVAVTVGPENAPYFVVEPILPKPGDPELLKARSSRGLSLPGGDVFYYYCRDFHIERIPGELFGLPEHDPYSDLYVTDQLVELASAEHLTGLERLELVWDQGPVVPRYPVPPAKIPWTDWRIEEEFWLMQARCNPRAETADEIAPIIEGALREGLIPWDFQEPRYERSAA